MTYPAFLVLVACGGEDVKECFRDSTCGPGTRCVEAAPGEKGTCQPCDAAEVPYDGIDNDCSQRTADSDLDGDGDNWVQSPTLPGGDCDDNDPTVSSKQPERCEDAKDNNCNGAVDEPACRDQQVPAISFVQPLAGTSVRGNLQIVLNASDDVGVAKVELFVGGQSKGVISAAPYLFQLDTRSVPDGQLALRGVATDVANRTNEASITVMVDNVTGPVIVPQRPQNGRSYGGRMTIEVDATDAAGVASVTLSIDGATLTTRTSTPYSGEVDTRGLTDGLHSVGVVATDGSGATSHANIDFTVDNTGPVISFTPASGNVTGQLTVTITAVDPGGVGQIESNGSAVQGDQLSYNIDTLAIPNGPLVITATATDNVEIDGGSLTGNRAVAQATLTVANAGNAPPLVILTSPQVGDAVYRRTVLTANANAPSGVRRVAFRVDGVEVCADTVRPFTCYFDFSRKSGVVEVAAIATDGLDGEASDTATVSVARATTFRIPDQIIPVNEPGDAYFDVADLDGDGHQDILSGGGGVSISYGLGGGSFAASINIEKVLNLAAHSADLDGDGDRDIVVLTGNLLIVYRNEGMRTWVKTESFELGTATPRDFAVGDLDGDGQPDVAIARNVGGDFLVAFQRGDPPTFGELASYGQVGTTTGVILADVNGDRALDVVLSRQGGNLSYFTTYLNGGRGVFSVGQDTLFPGGSPVAVAITDLNGDGTLDAVAALSSQLIQGLGVAYGNPANPGSFQQTESIPLNWGPSGIAAGDLTGDGVPEVVVTSEKQSGAIVMSRQQDGTFKQTPYIIARTNRAPILVDVNGDGTRDLVVTSKANDSIAIAYNHGGLLRAPRAVPLIGSPAALAVAQMSGDALPDVVVGLNSVGPGMGAVELLENEAGTLKHVDTILLDDASTIARVATGNLDGRGGVDIAVAALSSFGSRLLLHDGTRYVDTPIRIDKSRWVTVANVNADPLDEAIFAFDQDQGYGKDGIQIIGGTAAVLTTLESGEGSVGILVGKLDSNDSLDIAVTNQVGSDIALFSADGAGWQRTVLSGVPGAQAMASGHLGPAPPDDYPDLVATSIDRVATFLGHPTLGFLAPTVVPTGSQTTRIVTGDFNGDGLDDVAILHTVRGQVAVLISRSQGSFFGVDALDVGFGPSDLVVADMDGDRTADLVVTSAAESVTTIFNDP